MLQTYKEMTNWEELLYPQMNKLDSILEDIKADGAKKLI
jgi:hypothetical protein